MEKYFFLEKKIQFYYLCNNINNDINILKFGIKVIDFTNSLIMNVILLLSNYEQKMNFALKFKVLTDKNFFFLFSLNFCNTNFNNSLTHRNS